VVGGGGGVAHLLKYTTYLQVKKTKTTIEMMSTINRSQPFKQQ
jgi:hypothetical protein